MTGQAGRGESEGDRDRWMDGRMSSVRGIRRACSRHKRPGRRLEEMPVTNTTDVGRSLQYESTGKESFQTAGNVASSTEDG